MSTSNRSSLLGRLSMFVILASGLGCSAKPPPETPVTIAFHPVSTGTELWLSTPIAVEITNETDARTVEAEYAVYVGELAVKGTRVRPAQVALVAAEAGATHFRVLAAGDDDRLDVVLYRVDAQRWHLLPASLRPAAAAGISGAEDTRASL